MQNVIIVHLRRPKSRTKNPDEKRSDPFWEFGSFGITQCHAKNLMHRKHVERLKGVRFAFAQGGRQGTRLLHLTPPVQIREHHGCIEATWFPHAMPFRYGDAPILVSNRHVSDFPKLKSSLKTEMKIGGRSTIEGQFSSKFRSRGICLEAALAKELIRVYEKLRKKAPSSRIANTYLDALPWLPPHPDSDRQHTYEICLDEARGARQLTQYLNRRRSRGCSSKKNRRSC